MKLSIFEMVENAYKVTLVGAIVPLFVIVLEARERGRGPTLHRSWDWCLDCV